VLGRRPEIQEFQRGKFIVYSCDELLQIRSRHPKGDAADAITVLECKHYSLFIFCSKAMIPDIISNDERKRGGICEHICYGCAKCTNEAETQVGR